MQKIILTTDMKDKNSQKRRKRKWELQTSKGGDVGSSKTQYLTERERQRDSERKKKQERHKGREGGRERKKGEIVAKKREISEVRTNVIKHVYKMS